LACVCVKNENENEVLLISSSRNDNHWIVPGGGIEDHEQPDEAARREVYEEAGVQGRLGRFLGVFESLNRKHRTSVYIFIVDKEFEDWEEHKVYGRKRKWFDLNEAKIELEKHKPMQGSYLSLLKGYKNNNQKANYFNNHANDLNIILATNTDNTGHMDEFNAKSSTMHYNGNLLISALQSAQNAYVPYSSYNSPHPSSTHLDHDRNVATSLSNTT